MIRGFPINSGEELFCTGKWEGVERGSGWNVSKYHLPGLGRGKKRRGQLPSHPACVVSRKHLVGHHIKGD